LTKILSEIIEVCVFRRIEKRLQYLLLQRASEEVLYPNIWQIITGTVGAHETSEKAALRELGEETGLTVKRFWIVPFVDSYFDRSKDAVECVPVFAIEANAHQKVRLSSEHQKYAWLSFSKALKRLVWPGQKQALGVVHKFVASKKETGSLIEIREFY
jgi:8-oxo-dGTP pyrophosphatase MutT (NUDIX family)